MLFTTSIVVLLLLLTKRTVFSGQRLHTLSPGACPWRCDVRLCAGSRGRRNATCDAMPTWRRLAHVRGETPRDQHLACPPGPAPRVGVEDGDAPGHRARERTISIIGLSRVTSRRRETFEKRQVPHSQVFRQADRLGSY